MRALPLLPLLLLAPAQVVEGRPGGLGRQPVLGWNTWCTGVGCGVDWCSSTEILSVAAEIKRSGMLAVGYDHILLDDCWGVRDASTGQIQGDAQRFPEGMPAFIAKVHQLGFRFGLYTDIGAKACHSPFVGSYPHYTRDAATFASWKVDYVKFDGCDPPGLGRDGNLDNSTVRARLSLSSGLKSPKNTTSNNRADRASRLSPALWATCRARSTVPAATSG